jgi:hypothetical protein
VRDWSAAAALIPTVRASGRPSLNGTPANGRSSGLRERQFLPDDGCFVGACGPSGPTPLTHVPASLRRGSRRSWRRFARRGLKTARNAPNNDVMKVVVIASLEPEHLSSCLSALKLWVDSRDVTVLNNANRPHLRDQINTVCYRAGLNPLRPHDICDGRNTIGWLHETIKAVCRAFPDETVLKLDEDVFLVSARERIDPPPYTFLVPNVTINNYTT